MRTYDACKMTLASENGVNMEIETDNEIMNNETVTTPETGEDNNDTSTTIPTTPSTPIFSTPTIPATSSDTASLTMETYTPTKLDDWALWQSLWMGTKGSEYFQISFSQDQ